MKKMQLVNYLSIKKNSKVGLKRAGNTKMIEFRGKIAFFDNYIAYYL